MDTLPVHNNIYKTSGEAHTILLINQMDQVSGDQPHPQCVPLSSG